MGKGVRGAGGWCMWCGRAKWVWDGERAFSNYSPYFGIVHKHVHSLQTSFNHRHVNSSAERELLRISVAAWILLLQSKRGKNVLKHRQNKNRRSSVWAHIFIVIEIFSFVGAMLCRHHENDETCDILCCCSILLSMSHKTCEHAHAGQAIKYAIIVCKSKQHVQHEASENVHVFHVAYVAKCYRRQC